MSNSCRQHVEGFWRTRRGCTSALRLSSVKPEAVRHGSEWGFGGGTYLIRVGASCGGGGLVFRLELGGQCLGLLYHPGFPGAESGCCWESQSVSFPPPGRWRPRPLCVAPCLQGALGAQKIALQRDGWCSCFSGLRAAGCLGLIPLGT